MHVHTKAQNKIQSKKAPSKNKRQISKIKIQQNQKFQQAKNTTSEKCNKPPGPQLSPATSAPATPQPPSPQLKIQEAKNT